MAIVSSKVNLNMSVISNLTRAKGTALAKTAEALKTEVVINQVIPFDTGTLQNTATYVDSSQALSGVAKIYSSTPYARRLYFHPEYNFSKKENKNAKGKWYEDWIEGDKQDFARKTFVKFYKAEGGL